MTRQRLPLRFFKVNGATAMAMLKARNNFTRNSAMTTFNEAALAAWKEATAAALVGHSCDNGSVRIIKRYDMQVK